MYDFLCTDTVITQMLKEPPFFQSERNRVFILQFIRAEYHRQILRILDRMPPVFLFFHQILREILIYEP